jgi:hypothetical protein
MDIRLASSESGSLVKSARSYVIDGSAKPKAFRHPSLGEVEQCQPYASSLCCGRNENLIQAPDIRLQSKKAEQMIVLVTGQIDRPPR